MVDGRSMKIAIIFMLLGFFVSPAWTIDRDKKPVDAYSVAHQKITVDGSFDDWTGIPFVEMNKEEHLFVWDETLSKNNWNGPEDFSVRWRAAWFENKLYFQIQVTDDVLAEPAHANTWGCDSTELFFDPTNSNGKKSDNAVGYEIHWGPWSPEHVWIDAVGFDRATPGTQEYKNIFNGESVLRLTDTGYAVEAGLSLPGIDLEAGTVIGMEFVSNDDDGSTRESQMTMNQNVGPTPFWDDMSNFIDLYLEAN